MAPLYLTCADTGIVVDCGYEGTRVLPVESGVPIFSAYTESPFGGRVLDAYVDRHLEIGTLTLPVDERAKLVEDIKVQYCYARVRDVSIKDVVHSTGFCGAEVRLSAEQRWQCVEPLFNGLENAMNGSMTCGIANAIAQAVNACPLSSRHVVAQNIIVVGGTACMRGFLPRLAVEVEKELSLIPTCHMVLKRLAFSVQDQSPLLSIWHGASIFAGLEGATDYTEAMFRSDARVSLPDWTIMGCA